MKSRRARNRLAWAQRETKSMIARDVVVEFLNVESFNNYEPTAHAWRMLLITMSFLVPACTIKTAQ